MNFEKLALIKILREKDEKLLASLKPDFFKRASNKVIFKALQSYVHKHAKIPTINVLSEGFKSQLSEEKAQIYIGILEGFDVYSEELPSNSEIRSGIEEAFVIVSVEQNLEKLVEATKERDLNLVRQLLGSLQSNIEVSSKMPENVVDMEYSPSQIRTVQSWMPSQREAGLALGGLVLVAGSSGGGKSIFTLQQLMHSYKKENVSCCLLNLELGQDETIARMYCHDTGEDFTKIYGDSAKGTVERVEKWKRDYFSGTDKVFKMKNIRFSTSEIESVIRLMASEGITLIGLDYIQLVDNDSSAEEWKSLTKLVRLLHQLTLELGIVIVTPVQVNASDVSEKNGELKITPRGSRELEFSSSVFLYIMQTSEEYKEGVARIFTIKARNAQKHAYMVYTKFAQMCFEDSGVVI